MKNIICLLIPLIICITLYSQVVTEDDKPAQDYAVYSKKFEVKPFTDVVKDNWKKWVGDSNEICRFTLVAQFKYPENKQEIAAALVTIVTRMRGEKKLTITFDDAIAMSNKKTDSIYNGIVNKINNINRTLFATGKPDFNKMQQGYGGDCFFFSGAGWIAKYRNDVIVNSIKVISDKKYKVAFPNGEWAIVNEPTDAEMAYNDSFSTLSDGMWMPILEKALGEILQKKSTKYANIPDPTISIDAGGGPAPDVRLWTGNETKLYYLGEKVDKFALREGLIKMQKYNLMSQALVPRNPKGKIIGDHVYAIMEFDANTNMLLVWNPWGTNYKHKGPDCPENGYNRTNGFFNISLDDFILLFSCVAIEVK